MIIDGGSINFNFNPSSTNQLMYRAKSTEEAEALKKYISESGKNAKIIEDFQADYVAPRFDGFETGLDGNGEKVISGSKFKEIVWQSPFEQEYTADDALNNNWFSSTQSSIFNSFRSGATVADESVIGMDKAEFLSYVRNNGLDKEINWKSVSNSFNGSSSFDKFSDYTDYSAALYASLENRIMTDFTGDEQLLQLENLNKTFENAVNKAIKNYTSEVNETFKNLGVNLPDEDLAQGIRDVMNAKKDEYKNYIKSNSDYAKLADSEDKWLERDVGYMANALRNSFKPSKVKSENGWGENDIVAVGMMARMYFSDAMEMNLSHVTDYNDEESIGLAISMNYLMLETSMDDFDVSDSVRKFGEDLFNKYAESTIKREDKGLEFARNAPHGTTSSAFSALNKDDIYAVLDMMKKTYGETKDASKAIYATTSFAHNTFKSKANSTEYSKLWRYNSPVEGAMRGQDFWGGFYDSNSSSKQSGGMGKIIEKWNGFANSMNKKDLTALFDKATTNLFHTYRSWKFYDKPLVGGFFGKDGGWWGTKI